MPWVSLFLEERWSLTSDSLSDGFYCTMGVIIFRKEGGLLYQVVSQTGFTVP